ncbi:MAG: hydroxymethylbilane synthase [Candidatus Koribacter versatilis]|uniref:Porphobilinogen deaminase n=1 Tax=Candidatus Korobacter versatilis TaxID=658062 RepID=A0A932EPD1_9BACT|nr:hydroxymethylbilane synthase [Candidatus Koribacter versatilis]
MARLRIGSRGSQLAFWQANHVATELRSRGHEVEILVIKTTGDRITDVALSQVGTKGMFTKEIEEALAAGDVDLAVHSLKDLPTDLPPGFEIAAITKREDPRDAFLSAKYGSLIELPPAARVGTSSLRRQAQLRQLRADLDVQPLRGNVDTRLRKLQAGEYDAIILAAAGLNRLGLTTHVCSYFDTREMCPAVGQGALALEIRAGDAHMREALAVFDSLSDRASTDCERAVLRSLGGGCQVPIGAYAHVADGEVSVVAVVADPTGTAVLREGGTGADAEKLGRSVGETLLKRGAAKILEQVYGKMAAAPEQP